MAVWEEKKIVHTHTHAYDKHKAYCFGLPVIKHMLALVFF